MFLLQSRPACGYSPTLGGSFEILQSQALRLRRGRRLKGCLLRRLLLAIGFARLIRFFLLQPIALSLFILAPLLSLSENPLRMRYLLSRYLAGCIAIEINARCTFDASLKVAVRTGVAIERRLRIIC
jgi:hypothetical protein